MRFAAVLVARIGVALIATVWLPLWSTAVRAQSFNQFVGFGDSTLDSGWYFTHPYSTNATVQALYNAAVAAGGGVPTTPGGAMNSTILASRFGLTAIPVGEPGGTNYAAGGATNIPPYPGSTYTTLAPTTVSQVQSYLAAVGGVANPNALYMVSSGGNDISGVICPGVCAANANQLALNSAAGLSAAIAQLQAAGGRYFVVPILYGAGPVVTKSGAFAATEATYNHALYADLAAAGVNFVPVSGKVIADAIGLNPGLFGLTNVTAPACVNPNPAAVPTAWAAVCTTLVSANAAQTYLYADDRHYSAAGQLIEADYAYSLIVAPSEISYLAEVPVKTRTTVVDSIFQQIAISDRQRVVGSFNAWVTGAVSALSMANSSPGFPSDPGTPVMATIGADYLLAPDWLVGAAVSVGTTSQSFSLGGNFRQNEYVLSGYAAYTNAPIWIDMIGSYGGLHDDVNRIVPIGIATISNTGSTNGNNMSLAAEAGYNFTAGLGPYPGASVLPTRTPPASNGVLITHGPVAGLLLQRIYVNGFQENDPFAGDPSGGFTALAYAGQMRNSAVTELGYQASTDIGIWHPYAKLAWNHELASPDRLVTAMEPEIPFAPAFSMPAVIFGSDWGTATLGTTAALGRGIVAYASFTSEIGQNGVVTYGGQVGLNVALNAPAASTATR